MLSAIAMSWNHIWEIFRPYMIVRTNVPALMRSSLNVYYFRPDTINRKHTPPFILTLK